MSDIKLIRRYPDSKTEDITDAYMRGVEVGRAMRMDEIEKLREEFDKMDKWHSAELIAAMKENAKLRELVLHMHTCLEHYEPGDTISCEQCPYDNETWGCDYERLMAERGIEVDA